MDFLDPKKQHQHTVRLFIGYILVAIMILLATTTLIYYAYGFNVTRSGELVQRGLVFVSSQPSGADLRVNGKLVDATNTKLNLNAGTYLLNIKRDGYDAWTRSIEVQGSSVDHYVYPFLFPTKLTTKSLKTFDKTPALVTQSLDRRWLVMLEDPVAGTFDEFDLRKSQSDVAQSDQFTVPASLLTAPQSDPKWELVEWSNNNRHMLLKHFYTEVGVEKFEYILVDRQRPEGSHNLSRELGVTPTQLTLHNQQPDSYYLYDQTAKTLSTATLDQPQPVLMLNEVLAYKTHGENTILYATDAGAVQDKATIIFRQNDQDYPLRSVTRSDVYLLNAAQFDGHWYAALGSQAESRVFIYKDPTQAPSTDTNTGAIFALRVDKPTDVSFSANAQFVAVQNGSMVHLYDIDNTKGYRYALAYPLDAPQKKADWMDGDRLTYVGGGKQVAFDYDNINRHELVPADPNFPSAFDRDYRYMYSLTAPADGSAGISLSATALRIPNDL